ncbi:type I-E CRISPR-associated protein Cse2/CasB [Streptomyces olivoreticuli]
MTTSQPPEALPKGEQGADAFITYVLKLCENKRIQAELRTGLGRPVERCNYLHRYLVPFLPDKPMHRDRKRAYYAVAALIAARPRQARDAAAKENAVAGEWWSRPNLGASFALAVRNHALKPDSAEGELHLLTRQGSDAIHPRLPALTRHFLIAGATVDWAVLLEDLSWWNRSRDRIATRWLESYFRTLSTGSRHTPGTLIDPDSSDPTASSKDAA